MSAEQKLKDLGLTLPTDGSIPNGKVGKEFTTEQAYDFARNTGLGLLAAMKEAAGSLDKVEVLKLLGMVNGVPDYGDQPKVINGCSDLLVAVLGENGRHARSAVGMGSLPGNMPVEIEAIIKVLP
jgi:enamine deaminase RidA (YjgF/YER057c/UK114 family)